MNTRPVLVRFNEKIQRGNCWEWIGYVQRNGYGRFYFNGRPQFAHRASYELFVGPIAEGLTIDHLCRNTRCVRPDHLEAVPIRTNVLRGTGFAARFAAQTECLRGHPLADDNLYIDARGGRVCRRCRADIALRKYHADPEGKAKQRAKRAAMTPDQRARSIAKMRQYRAANLERARERDRLYHQQHREQRLAQKREYRAKRRQQVA